MKEKNNGRQSTKEFENKFGERQAPVPVNLQNRFQNLEEPSVTEQHKDATPPKFISKYTNRKH